VEEVRGKRRSSPTTVLAGLIPGHPRANARHSSGQTAGGDFEGCPVTAPRGSPPLRVSFIDNGISKGWDADLSLWLRQSDIAQNLDFERISKYFQRKIWRYHIL
jgi:hypothetical protein